MKKIFFITILLMSVSIYCDSKFFDAAGFVPFDGSNSIYMEQQHGVSLSNLTDYDLLIIKSIDLSDMHKKIISNIATFIQTSGNKPIEVYLLAFNLDTFASSTIAGGVITSQGDGLAWTLPLFSSHKINKKKNSYSIVIRYPSGGDGYNLICYGVKIYAV